MRPFVVKPLPGLKGGISLLGDKSIAHRSIIISALCKDKTRIENFPANKDCLCTLKALKKLGIKISQENKKKGYSSVITVSGSGLRGLNKPRGYLFTGDSGTTLRLLLGVLAGQRFVARLVAGSSLSLRPMLRVTGPLRAMGAKIYAKVGKTKDARQEEYPPITISGGKLEPITYRMPLASAQVKSAILLAGLYARGTTRIIEPVSTRDHTERMLKLFGAGIKTKQNTIVIKGNKELISPGALTIPGDISSASFFIVASALLPDSQLLIRNVSLNPTRTGIIKVLKRMGARIQISKLGVGSARFEPRGDIIVKGSKLKGIIVKKGQIPSLIDELPILMVAACLAQGKTVLEGASELRVKETDRIRSMTENLSKMGADIRVSGRAPSEKIVIRGVKQLRGARVRSYADHRTAMSMAIAGLTACGRTRIDDISCISKSFPDFISLLNRLSLDR